MAKDLDHLEELRKKCLKTGTGDPMDYLQRQAAVSLQT
jgi:hypothetical protein